MGLRYEIPKTPFYISVDKNGYELHETTGTREDGTPTARFIWHFSRIENLYDALPQLILSKFSGAKSIDQLPKDWLKLAAYVNQFKREHGEAIAKARRSLSR